jgi:hypothetical protein
MTEAEWLACEDPEAMLGHLEGKASPRKLRLFECACCRRTWHLLEDARSREAIEVSERFADGLALEADVQAADVRAWKVVASFAILLPAEHLNQMQLAQCDLLRDLFGNPFRPATCDPTWRTPTAVDLAQAAYDERILPAGTLDPALLAVLADALEEAGCSDRAMLSHLREPGPHVRGCWVVDLILNRG